MKSHPLFFLIIFLPAILTTAETGPEKDANFSHEITTDQKPWTNREFLNDPDDFQFAIVTDRTGGMRPGVFARAVGKVNQLRPEFVISVGDLIPGGIRQRDENEIRRQWNEFNGFIEGFDMPFFYLAGNHDVSNALMDQIWDEMYGVRYYSFVYKDVLFLCLNTQDGEGTRPFLGEKQIAWAKEELEKHSDVRWTCVFIHQPLWVMEEGIMRNVDGERVLRKSKTGWPEVEAALTGRRYSVYAGHVHRYAKYERNDANYYTLGTTGGGSALRGAPFGEFDHATWITMTDEGPRMMNLTLDGMLPDDATTESIQKFSRSLNFTENFRETFPFKDKTLTLTVNNPLEVPFSGRLFWILPASDHWKVSPRRTSMEIAPGESATVEFAISHEGDTSTYFPLPRVMATFQGDNGVFELDRNLSLPLDLTEHVKKYPEKSEITGTSQMLIIDGKLDDQVWQTDPTIARLIPRQADGYAPVDTITWMTYDDTSLYVAVRCQDPLVRDVVAIAENRDGAVREDDSIELMIDTNHDKKTFYHFAINPSGTLYDARGNDAKWNSGTIIATTKEDNAWTIEMSIPLSEIGGEPGQQPIWGFQMARNRPRLDERKTYQWSPTFWYGNYLPSLFGEIKISGLTE